MRYIIDGWRFYMLAGHHAETSFVPWAGDNPMLQHALIQRTASVRAAILDGVADAVHARKKERPITNLHFLHAAFGNIVEGRYVVLHLCYVSHRPRHYFS